MFGILAKFFRFSGRENGNKFKLSIVIGLIEALASAMKIPAIMYILIGLLSGKIAPPKQVAAPPKGSISVG